MPIPILVLYPVVHAHCDKCIRPRQHLARPRTMDVGTLDPHLLHAEAFIHMVVPMVVSEVANGDDDVVALFFFFFSTSLFLFPLLSILNPPLCKS